MMFCFVPNVGRRLKRRVLVSIVSKAIRGSSSLFHYVKFHVCMHILYGVRQMQTADLQTQHTGLSQFIVKIILCNLRHSISCAVGLVRFDTWLLSRLSFRNKIRTCASFEKTLSNYIIVDSIIRARF